MDPITLLMLAVLAVLIFFMFRNSKKRQRDAAELQEKMTVGADVMTNTGIYGTIRDINEEANQVLLETTPGTVLTLHRQSISRVIEPEVEDVNSDVVDSDDIDSIDAADVDSNYDSGAEFTHGEPEFGQRLDDPDAGPTSNKPKDD